MPVHNTLVSYTNLVKPFGSQDALLAKTQDIAAKVIGDPAKAAAAMADLQAGLDQWQNVEIHPQILHTPHNLTASLLQSHVVQRATIANRIDHFLLKIAGIVLEGLEVRFSDADWPDWAASFFTWIADIVPAVPQPPDPVAEPIANSFSIGVLGDFGTGLYGAPVCRDTIAGSAETYSMMLHLGDVYYSATPEEVDDRFFNFWPEQKAPVNRTLNGNHEMYNGGHSYVDKMLPRFNQKSNCFAMQNDNWVLIGLDTALHQAFGGQEGVLDDPQMQWLCGIVQAAGPRKVVLFSHHQPFTQLDTNKGGNLLSQMEKYGLADKIYAWYWGHEHRCLLYDRHPRYGFYGRCMGHAAFPQARPDLSNAPFSPSHGSQWRQLPPKDGQNDAGETVPIPGAWIYDTNNLYIPDFATRFAPNGFLRLEFDGAHLVEFVRSPGGANVWLEELTAAG
ncbi:MAG TPA: metallophosphoesterase [Verrucomicrobiae bacterium]|nr:metallophosphoesterase [Verrucomicrobiae bacterium]